MIERHVVLGSDEGAVAIRAWDEEPIRVVGELSNTTLLSDPMTGGELWLTPADQWGPFDVTTRVLDAPPDDPGVQWEDVIEFSMRTSSEVVVTELVNGDPTAAWLDCPGDWRVRLSARNRGVTHDEDGDNDSLEPVEWFLLEAWPASEIDMGLEPQVIRLTSAWAQAELAGSAKPLVIPEGEAGLAAAQRIGRDVDQASGSRHLSGQLANVEVSRSIRGTRRRLFPLFSNLTSWTGWWKPSCSWGAVVSPVDDPYALDQEEWGYVVNGPDIMAGTAGAVRWSFAEVDKPRRSVRRWNWVRRVGDRGPSPFYGGRDLLAVDSTLTAQLEETTRDGEAFTTVSLTHRGVPSEWAQDLHDYWSLQLAIADHAGFGLPKK